MAATSAQVPRGPVCQPLPRIALKHVIRLVHVEWLTRLHAAGALPNHRLDVFERQRIANGETLADLVRALMQLKEELLI